MAWGTLGKTEGKKDTERGREVFMLASRAADGLRPCYPMWPWALWVTYFVQPGMTCLQVCEVTTQRCSSSLVGSIVSLSAFEISVLIFYYQK